MTITTLRVMDHTLQGPLVVHNENVAVEDGGTTIIFPSLGDYVRLSLNAFMKYGTQIRLLDERRYPHE